jgi:hypothetical protein
MWDFKTARLMRGLALLAAVIGVIALPPIATQAQDSATNSITFTEEFLDAKLQDTITPDGKVNSARLDLQPGQIVISGTGQGSGGSIDFSITLTMPVQNGQMQFKVLSATVGGMTLDNEQSAQVSNGTGILGSIQTLVTNATSRRQVETVTITDTQLTITWERPDPDGPQIDVLDNSLSMTVTQDYVNGLPHVANPPDPRLENMSVDFQPGQLVITATRLEADGTPVPLSVTAAPTTYNGVAAWSITAMTIGGTVQDASQIGQMNDDIAASWRLFFSGLYRSGQLYKIVLSEDTLTLAWNSDLANPIAFQPSTTSLTVTEEAINNSFRVQNPVDYSISNVVVDLQPDQVFLTANLNLPSGKVLVEQVTFEPLLKNGFILWTVTAATLDGTPLDQAIIDRFNEGAINWWNAALWEEFSDYTVSGIHINDAQIEISARQR